VKTKGDDSKNATGTAITSSGLPTVRAVRRHRDSASAIDSLLDWRRASHPDQRNL